MRRSVNRLLICLSILFLTNCSNNRVEEPDELSAVDPDRVWLDYQVWGEEGADSVTVKLQFRDEEAGPTLKLDKSAKVELDGDQLIVNNSAVTGPYYEIRKPLGSFIGKHQIKFTQTNGRTYEEDFIFQPIVLNEKIPDTIRRGSIEFKLQGLSNGGSVRVLMTDTSYAGEGIDRVDTISNGRILISEYDLQQLANGPIYLELIREDEREVNEGSFEGGRITIYYGLKREFILVD